MTYIERCFVYFVFFALLVYFIFFCFNRPYFCFWIFPISPEVDPIFNLPPLFDLPNILQIPGPLASNPFSPFCCMVPETEFGYVLRQEDGERGKDNNRDTSNFGITVPLMREKRSCISLLLVPAESLFVPSQDWGKGQERRRGRGFLPLALPGRGILLPIHWT